MSQSYGNYVPTTLANPTDSITGVTIVEQELGTSISGKGPQGLAIASTLSVDDNGTTYSITIPPLANLYDIAASIQSQVVLAGDVGFTARFDSGLDQLILSSSTAGAAASKCTVTGGTAAPILKLGTANGGFESYATAEIITYLVTYLFVYIGASYGAGLVVVSSADMTTPTDLSEMETIANARAAQLKVELAPGFGINPPVVVNNTNTLNGPVVLIA